MQSKGKFRLMVAAFALVGGMAMAAVDPQTLVNDLQAQGYTWIEVTQGPSQIKIEAIKDGTRTETILDAATGAVLKTETEAVSGDEQSRTGVEIRQRDRDFLRTGEGDSSSTDDGASDDDGADHDAGDDHGGDDDASDHDSGDDHGGGDDGSDHDSGDDHGNDD